MGMISEFKGFAMRGNVMDMAVGIILGGAFGKIVSSFVGDILMPVVGSFAGGVNFADNKIVLTEGVEASEGVTAIAEVAVGWGQFVQYTIDFLIVAFAIFMVIRAMNSAKAKEAEAPPPPSEKVCAKCCTNIPIKATRCPNCTADLG